MKALKSILIAVVLLLAALPASAQRIFGQYPDNPEITSVYISPAAMRLGLKAMQNDDKGSESLKYVTNPRGMEVLTSENHASASLLREDCASIIRNLNLELLLNTQEKDESVNIYVGSISDDNKAKDILIETAGASEYTVVYIRGDIDINGLLNDGKK